MQHQPDLLELGQARLQLLKTLCLPTLQQQTSQNFLWIIRADPQLAEPLKKELLSLIDTATQSNPYFRVVVMATNENPVGFRKPLTETPDQIWTHNYYLLQHYQQAAQTRAVLETRLDADDGLHIAFVEVMQQEAREQLVDSESMMSSNSHSKAKSQGGSKQEDSQKQHTKQSKNWLMWCSGTHVEWQYGAPWEFLAGENSNVTKKQLQDAEDSMDSTLGSLMPGLTKGCITPGLTTGYGKYVNFDDVPNAQHHMLHRKVRPCHDPTEQQHEHNNKRCLIFWKEVIPAAIRGRTPTSAGMQFVLGKHMSSLSPQARQALGADEPELLREKQSMMWESVERRFDISKDSVRQMRNFLTDHMHGIVQDNYEGQCTQGHSCKNSSRIILKQLMEESVEPAAAGSNNNNNSTTTTTATSR